MTPEQPADPTRPPISTGFSASAAGDAFFVLRDCRELFVRRFTEIVRQASIAKPGLIEAFGRVLGEGFDELAASAQRDGFGETDGLTASRISLVGNDDLELEIRIGNLASRLKDNQRIDHWRTRLRMMTLLDRPKMDAESNPAGFQPLARGLAALCRADERTLDQKLDQLDSIEDFLQARLPEVYAELNALLEGHHVEPASAQIGSRAGGSRVSVAGQPPGNAATGTGNAPSALQQAMRQQAAGHGAPLASGERSLPAGSGNATLDMAALVMLKHLTERLNTLEQHYAAGSMTSLTSPTDSAAAAGHPQPLRTLSSKDLDLPLGQPAAIALDTLALIFEAIFTTPELPDAVKAAIARLQIPLLKLALVDASLFADEHHPARRLIDRMARAALGLAEKSGRDHPVCSALLTLADTVRSALESGSASGGGKLASQLAELDALIAARDQLQQEKAQPYIQLAREHLADESARNDTEAWLADALSKTGEPAMRAFLADYWQRVMHLARVDDGPTGTPWRECRATADELLWSLMPKQTADERKRLLASIPALLKRINLGLDRLDIPAAKRKPFLDACFELQTAALRNRPDTLLPPPAASNRQPQAQPQSGHAADLRIFERDGASVQYFGRTPAGLSADDAAVSAWRVGDWISFRRPEAGSAPATGATVSATAMCGRVCWQDSAGVLLFNTDWGYAIAYAPSLLQLQIRSGDARVVTEASLFDVAAAKALQGLAAR